MLELYHGSNLTIEQIDLSLCKPYKDIGKGFYLTDMLQQALDMAYRQHELLALAHLSLRNICSMRIYWVMIV